MANFSSFFPTAAAGGGGFTKMNKYSTLRSTGETTHYKLEDTTLSAQASYATGATVMSVAMTSSTYYGTILEEQNGWIGYTFVNNSTTHTITANTAPSVSGAAFNITISPALTAGINFGGVGAVTAPDLTVNPATDLGLSDGDSLGILLVGGGDGGSAYSSGSGKTGKGGKLFYQNVTISNASTDLVLTPGTGYKAQKSGFSAAVITARTESTITGGLTLTSADGHDVAGIGHSPTTGNGMPGVGGYGAGGNDEGRYYHGMGTGGFPYNSNSSGAGTQGADGAILLYY